MKNYQQIQATYIHTPFCVQKCLYCDFASYACRDTNIMKEYAQSVWREIANGGAVKHNHELWISIYQNSHR